MRRSSETSGALTWHRAFAAMLMLIATPLLAQTTRARHPAATDARHQCANPRAEKLLEQGMALQSELDSEGALDIYQQCLKLEQGCIPCRYEAGWSYWKLGRWEEVISSWESVRQADPENPDINQYLPSARENLAMLRSHKIAPEFRTSVELGTRSKPEDGPIAMIFSSRRQSYDPKPKSPLDHYDPDIQSPKSVRFSEDGKRVYVNSLEGGKTVVFDTLGFEKVGTIKHKFGPDEAKLFDRGPIYDYKFPKTIKHPNEFFGKPVELELSHGGRYLWAPYYRRGFDANGTLPSAVAVIDTKTNEIVRVMGTGPISKYVKASPKGSWMAISHWGDNSVGLIDIRGNNPKKFRRSSLLVVDERLKLKNIKGDRDRHCGFCVRGLAFTPDEKYLFVSRMSGGGIAAFELDRKRGKHRYLGTVFGILPGPRDLEMSASGEWLYMSCNASGFVAKVPVKAMLEAFRAIPKGQKKITVDRKKLGALTAYVGLGARSIRLSPDEHYVFASVNQTSDLVAVSTQEMKVEARIPIDSYPVGLDISPDGTELWVTSQGRDAKGGNSVGVFQVRYKSAETIHGSAPISH